MIDIHEVRKMKGDGMSYSRIANKLSVSPSSIQHYISVPEPANGKCQRCGSTKQLVNHHYDYKGNSIIVLCRPCHARVHTKKKNKFWAGYENMPESHHGKHARCGRFINDEAQP